MKSKLVVIMLAVFLLSGNKIHAQSKQDSTTSPTKKEYKNRIGTSIPLGPDIFLQIERKISPKLFGKTLSVGADLSYQFKGNTSIDRLYSDEVSFDSKLHVINPWLSVYLKEGNRLSHLFILKPSLVFLDTGGDNKDLYSFPAYEIMFGQIFEYKWFYAKVDYGIKHFLKYDKVSYDGEETYFPAVRYKDEGKTYSLLPSFGITFGANF